MGSVSEADLFLSHEFTHLVIGGGTAGLVMAARLSEDPSITVGILEAGPAALEEPRINVPGRLGETLFTDYDWQFETTPQPGFDGRKLAWNRGKVLGGSSAMNFMMWNRGNKGDYDAWEQLGNCGWGWDGILPYFKKTETFQVPDKAYQERHQVYFDEKYHGTDGPLHTIYSADYPASSQYWHATLNNLGVETNRSHQSGSNVGCWTSLTGVDPETQQRCYSTRAYYLPASQRDNLHLLTEATVRNVVLEKEGNGDEWRATGVRFMHQGQEHTVHVAGEIIISAGTIQSPQLLELSGIGDPQILQAAGIETKVANPNVGENLQDHMGTMMVYELDPSVLTAEALRSDPLLAAAADSQYSTSKTGLRTAVGFQAAYLPLTHFTTPEEIQKLTSQLPATTRLRDRILSQRFSSTHPTGQVEFIFDVSNYSLFFTSDPSKRYGTMMQILQYPFSVGSIHIPPSSSPSSPQENPTTSAVAPVINPRYYEGEGGQIDLQTMAAAQKFASRIPATSPLSDIIVKRVFPPLTLLREPSPSPSPSLPSASLPAAQKPNPKPNPEEEEVFTPWIRASTGTDWHPVGTCAMGGDEGIKGGVVDERLRVYGVRGLRVCDASIMPLQIAAHLQATVYAIGEKGADMLKEDWRARAS